MGKIAFVFAGQGAQYPGMGQELAQCSPAAAQVFQQLDALRPGTSQQCFSGTEAELKETRNTQPCMFAVELAAAAALEEKGLRADLAAGFSLGEIVGDTLFTHIEKADRDYEGCYQMLVAQFAQHFVRDGVHFINREDDTGDLGLRTSKLSYHPVALLEKYTVTIEEPCGQRG